MKLLKEELAWPTYKRFQVISNTVLFETVIRTSKKLKNRAVLSFKILYALLFGP